MTDQAKDKADIEAEKLLPCPYLQCTQLSFSQHIAICPAKHRPAVAAALRERDAEIDIGLQIAGSFFEALKPLNLQAIHVQNPGVHVTDLISQLAAANGEVERLKKMLLTDASQRRD